MDIDVLTSTNGYHAGNRRILCTYPYRDERGELLYEKVRCDPKEFRQRRPDGNGGWIWNLQGVRQVPYRLPDLLALPPDALIFIVEGEKDAEASRNIGLFATTTSGGAGAWGKIAPDLQRDAFTGRWICVIADNDLAGRKHAQDVAERLGPITDSLRILELPGLPEKGDLSDWLAAGGDAAKLIELANAAALWSQPEWIPGDAIGGSFDVGKPEDRFRSRIEDCNRSHFWPKPIPLDGLPPPAPFPLQVLPPVLRDFVADSASSLRCPPDFLALPLLVITGGAIGTTRRLHLVRKYDQWAILYILLGAMPGSGKSPAMRQITQPLVDSESRLRASGRHDFNRLWSSDGTPEGIKNRLKQNKRGLTLLLDETAGFIESMDRYTNKGGNDGRRLIISNWDCTRFRSERGDAEKTVEVENPYLPIYGLIQPDMIIDMMRCNRPDGRTRNDGLFDRFLVVYPTQPREQPFSFDEVPTANVSPWDQTVERILNWPHGQGDEPIEVKFSQPAKQAYVDFTAAHAREVESPEFDNTLRGHWSKLRGGYAPRLALILYALDFACDLTIEANLSAEHVQRAALLIDYFKRHAKRIRALVKQTNYDNNIASVWASITRNERPGSLFTLREVADRLRSNLKRRQVEEVLETLCEHYLIRQVRRDDRRAGPAFEMNPDAPLPTV